MMPAGWLLSAVAFTILEHSLLWALTPWIASLPVTGDDTRQKRRHNRVVAVEGVTKITGTIHNIIQIRHAYLVLMDAAIRSDRLHATSDTSMLMMHISAGFFLQDLINCIFRFSTEGPLYLLHAACCSSMFLYCGTSGHGHYYGAAFLMWECSTLFVHLRWLLFKVGLSGGSLYVANSTCMVVTFFCCRICWGYAITVRQFVDSHRAFIASHNGDAPIPRTALVFFVCVTLAMNSLNTWWFSLMLRGVHRSARNLRRG